MLAVYLAPFLPGTAAAMLTQLGQDPALLDRRAHTPRLGRHRPRHAGGAADAPIPPAGVMCEA